MLNEAHIPASDENNYQFKIWNKTVPPLHRDLAEHSHSTFEIVLFKSGKGLYTTESGVHNINANDIFVFSSNEKHFITDIYDGEPFSFLNIHFDPIFVTSSGKSGFSEENAGICYSHNSNFCNKLEANNQATDKIRNIILNIEKECETRLSEYELAVKNMIFEILIILLREFDYKSEDKDKQMSYSAVKTVRKVTLYVNEHLCEEIYLNDLADIVSLTPNYLCTLFKKTAGVSISDYVNEKRIEKACKLITSGKESNVLGIASECGFNSTASFNKTFKKYTGTTPSAYRKYGNYIML